MEVTYEKYNLCWDGCPFLKLHTYQLHGRKRQLLCHCPGGTGLQEYLEIPGKSPGEYGHAV